MATYHGCIKVTCVVCGWESIDDNTIEMINDMDGRCEECDYQFFRWENQDGTIIVSLKSEYGHDTLVLKEEDR
jgi:hypothetical protein